MIATLRALLAEPWPNPQPSTPPTLAEAVAASLARHSQGRTR